MSKSLKLFNESKKIIPGGVNSPVRAFKAVGGHPRFISSAKGAVITDADGKKYIDFVSSWGPLIIGHSRPEVIRAVKKEMEKGTCFGAPTEIELKLAEIIVEVFPSIEKIRMVNSGTEATMSAARLARAFTGKNRIIKFDGCYHGHSDSFLIKAGSGALTFGEPDSPGITGASARDTLGAAYNDMESVKKIILKNRGTIAAVIIEPVAGNMGCVLPDEGFLVELREITSNENILLIFDEIITGFRLARGGAQEVYGIKPDITTLGKIIGGGFPVGSYGGRKEIMSLISPEGPVYQAGTLSGNPVAMRAGYETLRIIKADPDFYRKLEKKSDMLEEGVKNNLKKTGAAASCSYNRIGSMSTLFFTGTKVTDLESAKTSDIKKFGRYFHKMLRKGIYLPPSQFETFFISSAHTERDIEKALKAQYESLKEIF